MLEQALPKAVKKLLKQEDPLDVNVNAEEKDRVWSATVKDFNRRVAENALGKLTAPNGGMLFAEGEKVKIRSAKEGGEPRLVELTPGLYDKDKLIKVLGELRGKDLPDAKIKELCTKLCKPEDQGRVLQGVVCATTPDVYALSADPVTLTRGVVGIYADPTGEVSFHQPPPLKAPFRPITGTIFRQKGDELEIGWINSADMYRKLLPYLTSKYNQAYYPNAMFSESAAHLADKSDEVMAKIRKDFEKLPECEIYAITPIHLRYYTDTGGRTGQRSQRWGIRNVTKGMEGVDEVARNSCVVYDGPAYMVGAKILGKAITGRLFIAPNCDFICSEWCQREVDKENGVDLITGDLTGHTLLTWCAVPGLHKFGGQKMLLASKEQDIKAMARARFKPVAARVLEHLEKGEPIRLWQVKPDPADATKKQAYYRTAWNARAFVDGHFLDADLVRLNSRMVCVKRAGSKNLFLLTSFNTTDNNGPVCMYAQYTPAADGTYKLYNMGIHRSGIFAMEYFQYVEKAVFVPKPLDAMLWDLMWPDQVINVGFREDQILHTYKVEDGVSPEGVDYTAGLCLDKAPLPPVRGQDGEAGQIEGVFANVADEADDDEHPDDEEGEEK